MGNTDVGKRTSVKRESDVGRMVNSRSGDAAGVEMMWQMPAISVFRTPVPGLKGSARG